MTEAVLYTALFLALYFQTFALLTFLSRDARLRREKVRLESDFPKVAIIVPCYNEAGTAAATAESLLALEYPAGRLALFLINDGSKDGTAEVLERYRFHPNVTVLHQENAGKHACLNRGIAATDAEFVGCLDADSFVHPGALKEILAHFDDERVAAVTASMTVYEPKSLLQKMQYAEYLAGVALRHIFAAVNGLYVTPGPFSFYRKSTLEEVGGFRFGHQTEDMEMAMRLQRHGFRIENAPRAQVYTKAPHTLWGLITQRTRWTSGFLRNSYDYHDLVLNPRYGALGLMVMPFSIAAIAASLALFVLALVDLARSVQNAIATNGEVPWSYAFSTPAIDWFYTPVTAIFLLGLIGAAIVIAIMYLGTRISGAQRPPTLGILSYLALYGLIAPLWLFRSARDVALNRRRAWR